MVDTVEAPIIDGRSVYDDSGRELIVLYEEDVQCDLHYDNETIQAVVLFDTIDRVILTVSQETFETEFNEE